MTDINHQISILQAFKKGKEIEFRYETEAGSGHFSAWYTISQSTTTGYRFDFQTFEYRVKPEIISINILKSEARELRFLLQNLDLWNPELQLTIENLVEQLKHVKK